MFCILRKFPPSLHNYVSVVASITMATPLHHDLKLNGATPRTGRPMFPICVQIERGRGGILDTLADKWTHLLQFTSLAKPNPDCSLFYLAHILWTGPLWPGTTLKNGLKLTLPHRMQQDGDDAIFGMVWPAYTGDSAREKHYRLYDTLLKTRQKSKQFPSCLVFRVLLCCILVILCQFSSEMQKTWQKHFKFEILKDWNAPQNS